jgi:dTDP-4-amino-4,6-dideoxygalactose transaminase
MKIHRTIPPTAAPVGGKELLNGLSGMFYAGSLNQKFEQELKEYFSVKHVFLVSSGKAALTLILKGLKGLSSKNEVLLPAYTCFSVPSAVLKAGLKVSLCDIEPSTFDYDYKLLEGEINANTLCVIAGNLFGIPSDIDRIKSLCQSRGIYLVEDGAQAMGGAYKGRKIGTLGDVGFFSLGRGKNITCGSGGIIITDSDEIAGAIRKEYDQLEDSTLLETLKECVQLVLMAIFIRPSLYWIPSGISFLKLGKTFFYKDFPVKKLSALKAGFLRNWRQRLEESNKIRMESGNFFNKQFQKMPLKYSDIPYLRWPFMAKNEKERDEIYSISQKQGLGLSILYPTAINDIREIKSMFNGKSFSSAKKMAETLLTLPTHHFVLEKDKKNICELIISTMSGKS